MLKSIKQLNIMCVCVKWTVYDWSKLTNNNKSNNKKNTWKEYFKEINVRLFGIVIHVCMMTLWNIYKKKVCTQCFFLCLEVVVVVLLVTVKWNITNRQANSNENFFLFGISWYIHKMSISHSFYFFFLLSIISCFKSIFHQKNK